ncbi:heavy metal-binding domain-containing protein [Lactobacillus acetotolerans]|uniref:heavy metal-binding domain-containing protein n=1 Tax=Lactobacillus acetotolerans TaxID=1600 RepID=UPI0019D27513|nr:heavy metal-binding domain-containing protein [Lactobacillus acetotolerans]MBN7275969.1 heavy metal-binding domain-containing protein [Lactobacillus acetotolerans]
MADILVTTTEHIPNQNYEIIGDVYGVITQSRNAISDAGANFKSFVGGEIKGYTKMLRRSRDEAINRMKKEVEKMDADAVVMMRFDNGSIGKDMQSVVAYGTAVKYID